MLARSGAALGAGAVAGVGGVAGADAAGATPRSLRLHGSGLRIVGAAHRPAAGAAHTFRGAVHYRPDGKPVGELVATRVLLNEHSVFDDGPHAYETHLFSLHGGTITGTGLVQHDGRGHFTITGGTGEFAGARGSYVSRHSADHSGTGEGLFTFTIG